MNTLKGCKLIPRAGLSENEGFDLLDDDVTIGRDATADLRIDKKTVSRHHCRLAVDDGKYILEDLDSSNGTFLNGIRVSGKATLKPGDLVSISPDIVMEFQAGGTSAFATKIMDTIVDPGQPAQARLIVSVEGSEPVTHTLDPIKTTIGRSTDNDVVIQSQVMSRYHAEVVKTGDQFYLHQLAEVVNPFTYQGKPVSDRIQLRDKDVIQIPTPLPDSTVRIEFQAADSGPRQPGGRGLKTTQLEQAIGDIPPVEAVPPSLLITIAGQPEITHLLDKHRITLGRAEDNDIVIPSPIVSRYHGQLVLRDRRYELVVEPNATNRLLFKGRPIERHRLHHNDVIRIESSLPGQMVSMTYISPADEAATVDFRTVDFGEKNLLTFGRDPANDIVIDQPTVSRYHAQVEKIGQRYRVIDLQSANGTFVNDQQIEADAWVSTGDSIRIGQYRFIAGTEAFTQFDETGGLKVDALGLNKWVRKDLNILKDISLSFQPREFIVVVGQSGGGKSTLLDAIAGYRPATDGRVSVNGIDVYKHFDAIRSEIGYVPQKDIIHMELTVYQALDYAARLRMPKDTTKSERHTRIMEVLEDLDLAHRKDVQISGLSGGQQKRVSIGVELLTKPGLFFLDEPTSGLDPGTETSFMHLMRRLADQGRTIVLVTHATKNVMLADKVVFLSRGGYLSWFGPPDEALKYFDQYRSERERRTRSMEFDQIYAILDDPTRGDPEKWAARYQSHPAYQEHIVQPLQGLEAQPVQGKEEAQTAPVKSRGANVSGFRQFLILSARNLKILMRDRSSLVLMLAAAPLVAMLDLVIAPMMGRAPYDIQTGDPKNGAITLFLMTIYCLLVAGLSQMREFVKEGDIYRRERLVNLKILPYVASKVWVAALLAFYHAIAYTVIHHIAFDMPGGWLEFGLFYVTLVLAAMAGTVSGLLASAIAPAASSAPMIMILFIIPQIVLSGVLAPVPGYASAPASTRWAFEGMIGIVGMGSDIAADPCWQLEEEVQDAMSLDDKVARGCRCMGPAVFDPDSCNFPGIGKYYKPEVDQDPPEEPAPLRPKPTEPVFPSPPEKPEEGSDQIAMTKYLNALGEHQQEVEQIQEVYKGEIAIYEAETEVFQAEMADYQEAYTEWEVTRSSAIGGAEGLIESINAEFGWAWVNKDDPEIFWPWLFRTWLAQSIIILSFIGLTLVMIKRKDVK